MGLGVEVKAGKAGSKSFDIRVEDLLPSGESDEPLVSAGEEVEWYLSDGVIDRRGEEKVFMGITLGRTMRAGERKGFFRTRSAEYMMLCFGEDQRVSVKARHRRIYQISNALKLVSSPRLWTSSPLWVPAKDIPS